MRYVYALWVGEVDDDCKVRLKYNDNRIARTGVKHSTRTVGDIKYNRRYNEESILTFVRRSGTLPHIGYYGLHAGNCLEVISGSINFRSKKLRLFLVKLSGDLIDRESWTATDFYNGRAVSCNRVLFSAENREYLASCKLSSIYDYNAVVRLISKARLDGKLPHDKNIGEIYDTKAPINYALRS